MNNPIIKKIVSAIAVIAIAIGVISLLDNSKNEIVVEENIEAVLLEKQKEIEHTQEPDNVLSVDNVPTITGLVNTDFDERFLQPEELQPQIVSAPCFGNDVSWCLNNEPRNEVELGGSVSSVIVSRLVDGINTNYIQIHNENGFVESIPEVEILDDVASVSFVDLENILYSFTCVGGECGSREILFVGGKLVTVQELINNIPGDLKLRGLFGYGPDWQVTISSNYIQLQEISWFAREYGAYSIGLINNSRPMLKLLFDSNNLSFIGAGYSHEQYFSPHWSFQERRIRFARLLEWILNTDESEILQYKPLVNEYQISEGFTLFAPDDWSVNLEDEGKIILYTNKINSEEKVSVRKWQHCVHDNVSYDPFVISYQSDFYICPTNILDLDMLKFSYQLSLYLSDKLGDIENLLQ